MARTIVLTRTVNCANSWKEYSSGKTGPKKKGSNELGKKDFSEVFEELSKQMGLAVTETTGGMYLKTIGYFFVWKIPRKMTYRITAKGEKRESKYNIHTGMYRYAPIFFPDRRIQYTSMDYTFCDSLKRRLKDRLIEGKKYKFYLSHFYRDLRPKGLGNKVRDNVENQPNNSRDKDATQ